MNSILREVFEMKKIINLIGLALFSVLLAACSGNKLDGKWVSYNGTDEYKQVVEINTKDEKISYKTYVKNNLEDTYSMKIDVDEDEGTITPLSGEKSSSIPYSIDDGVLHLGNVKYYREGSKQDKEEQEKAKKQRVKAEKQEAAEKAKRNKKKAAEQERNDAIKSIEEALNKEFLTKVTGSFYLGKAIPTDESYFDVNEYKYKIDKDGKMQYQGILISKDYDKQPKVEQDNPAYYTFVGITLPKKHTYTKEDKHERSSEQSYELPDSITEIKELNTLEKFADYQRVNNVTNISFEFELNGSDSDSTYITLNVNDLEALHVTNNDYYGNSDNDILSKTLPQGVKDEDFSF